MLTVHHLPASRSHRILWLLEELSFPYKLVVHARDPVTKRAPASLVRLSPFGKAPVLEDEDICLIESGAIIDHILENYGYGRLIPSHDAWSRCRELMHFAEATAMPAIMTDLTIRMGAQVPEGMRWMLGPDSASVIRFMADMLDNRDYMVGEQLSAADIQLWFVMRSASQDPAFKTYPLLADYLARLEARPAFQSAVRKGGPVTM